MAYLDLSEIGTASCTEIAKVNPSHSKASKAVCGYSMFESTG